MVTWTLENVKAGAGGTVTLTVKVLEGALEANEGPGKVINGGDNTTVKVGNDSEYAVNEVENPVPEEPHKEEIEPYAGNGVLGGVKVGDEIQYRICYRNYKAQAADVVITDRLDRNVSFVYADHGGKHDGAQSGGVVEWTISGVPAGEEGSVLLTVRVLESALASMEGPGRVVNGGETATVKVGNDRTFTLETVENPVPEEPVKTETVPYEGTGILGGVKVGDHITYEIHYQNYKAEAADVVITDTLDPNVRFDEASDDAVHDNAQAGGIVTWTLPEVAAGAEGTVSLTVEVLEGALESNGGSGEVVNGGDSAFVKVGNDHAYRLNEVENPVPEKPEKREITPYKGTGVLGAVKVGDEITYEIRYKNYKKQAADVTIRDTLDANAAFVSADHDGDHDGAVSGGVVTWSIKDVPAGADGTVKLTVKVLEGALEANEGPGRVINGGDNTTVKVGNDSEYTVNEVENPVPEVPHKVETAPYEGTGVLGGVQVGDEISYEISYRNYKTKNADVTIKDTLDAHVKFVSADHEGVHDGAANGGVVTWTLKDVPAGTKGTVTLKVKVLQSALEMNGGAGRVVNGGDTASVRVGNDSAFTLETVENPVPETPVKEEVSPYEGTGMLGAVKVGDVITYQIRFRNYKTVEADVVITDTLDPNVAFVSASDGGTHDRAASGGVVTWTLPAVAAGREGTVTLKVRVLESALESNEGAGRVINGGDGTKVKIGNDREYTLNTVENPVPEEPQKKETAPYEGTGVLGGVQVGDVITYTISFENYKDDVANVVIKDTLDPNVTFVAANHGGKLEEGTVVWRFADVAPGTKGTVGVRVRVGQGALISAGGEGRVVNGGDSTTVKIGSDNEYTLNTVENPVPEKPEKKEVAPYEGTGVLGSVVPGETVTYEITYRNYKTEAADVVIRDSLDANVEFVSADQNGRYTKRGTGEDAHTVIWTLKEVPAGKEGTVTLTVLVLEGAKQSEKGPGKISNGGDSASVQVGNDSAYTLNKVDNPVPEIPLKRETAPFKGTGTLDGVTAGDTITYEIWWQNYRMETADITIRDTLDPNVEFVEASNGGTVTDGVVIWKLAQVPSGETGKVTLTVRVKESALEANGGPGRVVNGGDGATVQVGNDHEMKLNEVENPVEEKTFGINITKVDASMNNAGLAGATLTLLDEDKQELVTWESDGKAQGIAGLEAGVTYTILEKKIPAGFEEEPGSGGIRGTVQFRIGTDGKVEVVSSTGELRGDHEVLVKNAPLGFEWGNRDGGDGEKTPSDDGKKTNGGGSGNGGSSSSSYGGGGRGSSYGGGVSGGGGSSAPKTGDETPIALYVILLLAAGLVITEEVIRRRRNRKRD